MDPNGWAMFVTALVAVYLIPGADMILVWQTGLAEGRAHALATALGLALARAVHVALAGLGLAALFHAVPWTFDLARLFGALYLLRLAVAVLRSPAVDPGSAGAARSASRAKALRRGLATNLLNPKALLFCSLLLPQFVDPGRGAVAAQFAALGVVLVAIGLAFDTVYAFVGAALARRFLQRPRWDLVRRALFAALLAGFALRLLVAPV
ncbi:MAG: LysE family translocator [Hyphomicrobiales bacterium]|nr:LysE family translocator [Hyphomicrobiales bacterium]